MEGGAQPRNSPAALPRRCPQTGHGLGDRKVGLGREPACGHTLKFVGHAPGPIGATAPASAPGSPKRPGGRRPVRLSSSGSQLPSQVAERLRGVGVFDEGRQLDDKGKV